MPQKPPTLTTMGIFADVLAQLRAADLTGLAPKLASMGIHDMDQLKGMTPEQIMGVANTYPELESLCHRDHRISEQIFPPLAQPPEDPLPGRWILTRSSTQPSSIETSTPTTPGIPGIRGGTCGQSWLSNGASLLYPSRPTS